MILFVGLIPVVLASLIVVFNLHIAPFGFLYLAAIIASCLLYAVLYLRKKRSEEYMPNLWLRGLLTLVLILDVLILLAAILLLIIGMYVGGNSNFGLS